MLTEAESLYQNALKLSEKDRADLAAKLLDSIDPDTEDEISAAWVAEVARRIEELDHGNEKTIPWSEARRIIVGQRDESPH